LQKYLTLENKYIIIYYCYLLQYKAILFIGKIYTDLLLN